ncbi:hypothetical protein LTR39_003981 [Cryomyces antarcticus]|nr:hypothetical protein LTR39_003981 [Cryomyces antarcticus]
MVLFQDKIIYMPSVPPFSRQQKIQDYEQLCRPVVWTEERIRSLDGTDIALCVGKAGAVGRDDAAVVEETGKRKKVVILYFQGNASSLPPRLPDLSRVLTSLSSTNTTTCNPEENRPEYSIVALSYRGFWTSRGRVSQKGIERDALAALAWITASPFHAPGKDVQLILWGQSIGAGVAATAAAAYLQNAIQNVPSTSQPAPNFLALILETPFVSIRDMLAALYPQRWLPYRYLHPFLWNHWDTESALRTIRAVAAESLPEVLLLPAAKDEVVPPDQADRLLAICGEVGLEVRRVDVAGALHTEAMAKREGRDAVVGFQPPNAPDRILHVPPAHLHARKQAPEAVRQSRIDVQLRLDAALLAQDLFEEQPLVAQRVLAADLEEGRWEVRVAGGPEEGDPERGGGIGLVVACEGGRG